MPGICRHPVRRQCAATSPGGRDQRAFVSIPISWTSSRSAGMPIKPTANATTAADVDFRGAYSSLVRAIWSDPSIEDKIKNDPSILQQYGFTSVPDDASGLTVLFKSADSALGGLSGFQSAANDWSNFMES